MANNKQYLAAMLLIIALRCMDLRCTGASGPPSATEPSTPSSTSLSTTTTTPSNQPILPCSPTSTSSDSNQNPSQLCTTTTANTAASQADSNHVTQPNNPQHIPLAAATRKFVKLGNNTSSTVRAYNYANSHYISSYQSRHNNNNNNNQSSDLVKPGDNQLTGQQQQQQAKKSLFEKICIGTSNRMSGQHNKTDHYQNLAERYRNCTYVIGNLEITWLGKGPDNKPIDLTFLESIREITGYLLIAYVEVDKISMPNLQIIRGRDLFKLNNGQKDDFAMFLIQNELKTLELPNLREILAGSVGSYNNRNLCHIRTINWDEILNWPMYRPVFVYNGTGPECAPCDPSCQGSCWGEGPEMCQKFSKTNCSPQCSQGRCFGSLPRECCHLFCAGGCTGPKQTDCLSCKNFFDDGECIQECPSMMRYNPSKFLWETNPNGKYAFGATCVKECPDHLLRDNGACVRTCPPNKRSSGGECVPCGGPCPKNCQGVEVVHSGNIDQLINCTVIEGSIAILDTSFTGYAEVYNNTIGERNKPMHPSKLEAFRALREITGYLNIQASHPEFKNLSYFRNLKTIGGRQTTDMFHALSIIKTSLVSLNLRSLKRVRSGRITIEENKDLCFADSIDWLQINVTKREDITIRNNADQNMCRNQNLKCHDQCSHDGCWGPGPDECLSCNNYKLDDFCVDNCTSTQSVGFLSYDSGSRVCKKCHPECKGGCSGPDARNCWQCKNVKDGPYCVAECPSHKYNNQVGVCEECDKSCVEGCTGPSNRLGEGGCQSCGKAVINSTNPFITYCIKSDETCPEGFYQEYVGPQPDGPLKSSSGKPVCRKCHHRCKSCTGMGTHTSVCECAKYVAGEQCEDYCSRDYYADEQSRQCNKCSVECNGCFGPSEADCITCRYYRIYSGPYSPLASAQVSVPLALSVNSKTAQLYGPSEPTKQQMRFNCTAQCPPDKPHRISDSNMLDPYCSEIPGNDGENPRIVSIGSTSFFFLLIISAALMFCVAVYRCQIEKDKTVKLTMRLSGFDDSEPLDQSNVKPNLAPLRSIKETELRKGKVLGHGFGGTVYQGVWFPEGKDHKERKPVAIKVLRDNGQPNMNKEFLDEAYIMASVKHPNLVQLLAVCMTPNQLMLITQLMPLGCLLDHVRTQKKFIGSKNLLEWCKQIARGMAYLEGRRLVHRDLALRNVLLQHCGKALISDFGLAKFLEVDQSEYRSGGGRLPIKWLAPECIRERKFTHKSDVWAFGVTIWELLTFGQKPFDNYDPKDVPLAIEKGARLSQPPHVTTEVAKVMLACWFYQPEERPDFESLKNCFSHFARDPQRYLSCSSEGIDYSSRQDLMEQSQALTGDGTGAGDDDAFGEIYACSESNIIAINDDGSPPRSTGELANAMANSTLPANNNNNANYSSRLNDVFGFELRHHSELDAACGQPLPTPTLKKSGPGGGFFHAGANGQTLIDENVFTSNGGATVGGAGSNTITNGKLSTTPPADLNNNNNNNNGHGRLMSNGESCWSMHHTVSTNSLGQKSEQPTDLDDYLLPSPCSNDNKFSEFLARHEAHGSKQSPAPAFTRDPPHSAGLIGISNDEYFLTRINYVSTNGSHGTTNASSGHIPHSLV